MPAKKRGQNEGSIFEEKPGRWVALVTTGYVIRNGKRCRVRKKFVAPTRDAVHRKLTKALRDQQRGRNVSPRVQTLGGFLDMWLADVAKPAVRPKTFRTYSDMVKLHIKPAIGAVQLEKLTPDVVQTFLNDKHGSAFCPHCKASFRGEQMPAHITGAHPKAKKKGYRVLGARSVGHLRGTLRGALAVAMEWYDLDRNVAALAKPPRAQKKEMRSLTPDEARAYLESAKSDRLEALFTVTVALGLRQAEILGLGWEQVDLAAGTLDVRRQLQRIDGKLVLVETKTEDGARPLLLPAVAIAALRRHHALQDQERRAAGDQWQETGLVFTTSIGTPADARNIIRRHHAILKSAGIPRLRFHDLRHSAATLLLAQGVSPKYISQLLGHKQVAFTMQTYMHVIKEVQQQTADKMDAILNPVAPQVATQAVSVGVNQRPN
jgi:integrase